MSAASINRAANDPQLQSRILAMAQREIIFDPVLADSWYGRQLRTGMTSGQALYFPVAVDTEAAYETAVNSGRGAPGHDVDVIPDAALTSAILAHWPVEPPPITPPATVAATTATDPPAVTPPVADTATAPPVVVPTP